MKKNKQMMWCDMILHTFSLDLSQSCSIMAYRTQDSALTVHSNNYVKGGLMTEKKKLLRYLTFAPIFPTITITN